MSTTSMLAIAGGGEIVTCEVDTIESWLGDLDMRLEALLSPVDTPGAGSADWLASGIANLFREHTYAKAPTANIISALRDAASRPTASKTIGMFLETDLVSLLVMTSGAAAKAPGVTSLHDALVHLFGLKRVSEDALGAFARAVSIASSLPTKQEPESLSLSELALWLRATARQMAPHLRSIRCASTALVSEISHTKAQADT